MFTYGWSWPTRWSIRLILGFWGIKVHKNVNDSLAWMPIKCHAKLDAARFILGGEICKRTNKQTVTNISTPCLSTCVNKEQKEGLTGLLTYLMNLRHKATYQQTGSDVQFPRR